MKIKSRERAGWGQSRSRAAVAALAVLLAFSSACAAKKQGPVAEPLPDGRPGFMIREVEKVDGPARADFERAVALMNAGNDHGAIELLKKVIARSPGLVSPQVNIAMAYLRNGKQDLAERHFKTALYLVPGHPVASNEYGLLLRARADFKKARKVFERAVEHFPGYLPVHRNLGILCDLYLSDPGCALEQFEIYGQAMPADEQVKLWIAELRIRLGKN